MLNRDAARLKKACDPARIFLNFVCIQSQRNSAPHFPFFCRPARAEAGVYFSRDTLNRNAAGQKQSCPAWREFSRFCLRSQISSANSGILFAFNHKKSRSRSAPKFLKPGASRALRGFFARRAQSRRSATQKSLRPGADFLQFCLRSIGMQFGSTIPEDRREPSRTCIFRETR